MVAWRRKLIMKGFNRESLHWLVRLHKGDRFWEMISRLHCIQLETNLLRIFYHFLFCKFVSLLYRL